MAVASAVIAAAVALLRFVDFDAPLLYAIVPLAPVVATLAAIGAAWTFGRRAAAVAVGGAVLAGLLVLPGPVTPRLGCEVRSMRNDADVVIFSHNVELGADNPTEVAAQIIAVEPDVVLLQEGDGQFVERLLPSLDGAYPHLARSVGTGPRAWPR